MHLKRGKTVPPYWPISPDVYRGSVITVSDGLPLPTILMENSPPKV